LTKPLRIYVRAFSGLPAAVWLIAAAALVNRAGTMVLPFLGLYLVGPLGMTKKEASLILLAFGAGSVIGSYLGGRLSDRFGAIRVQEGALFGGACGFAVLPMFESTWTLAAGVLATAAISDAFRPAAMTATVELAPGPSPVRALALLRLAANLGMGIGPAAGGLLATHSYEWLFYGDALTCLIAAAVLWRWLHPRQPLLPEREHAAPSGGRSPWRDPPFLGLMAGFLALSIAFLQVFGAMPIYFREHHGLPEGAIGILIGLNALMIAAFEMPLVGALEHRDAVRIATCGALLIGLGLGVIPLGSGVGFLVATVAIWTLGEMLCLPFANALVAERAGPGTRGAYMGAFTTTFALGTIIAPPAGLLIYDQLGGNAVWLAAAALAVAAAAILTALRTTLRRPAQGQF
jgi:MFS family permease